MHFDLCYVIALPSGMRLIPAGFTLDSLFWPPFTYIIPQRPQEVLITLKVTMCMPTRSRCTTTEPQMVPIGDPNRHKEAATYAV